MAERFVDRVATQPNRYKIIPADGAEYYATLERADEPIEVGTPLNAENLNGLLDRNGGTMQGDIHMDGHRITGLPEPTTASEPATKYFVENFTIEGSTYVATDDYNDGNVVIRPYVPSFDIDATLSMEGKAADAKATGEALAGKASSGFGWGEGKPHGNIDANTANRTCVFVSAINTPTNDSVWLCEFYATSDDGSGKWGHMVATCQGGVAKGCICHRLKEDGVWTEWEWENPPLLPGTEYRTTERFNGQPVYTKVVNLGSFTGTTTIPIGNGYRSYIRVHAIAQYSGKTYFEKVADTMIKDYQNAGLHYIQVIAGDATISNGFVQIWYL